jgi:DNA-binding beta-propeller fold protein YncE
MAILCRTLREVREPQGIAYVPLTDTVYVAKAEDGSARLFQGADLTPGGQISLGSDADNVRVNEDSSRVFVGFGNGGLAGHRGHPAYIWVFVPYCRMARPRGA